MPTSDSQKTPCEIAAETFGSDPANWSESTSIEFGRTYDFVNMATGKVGQCWTDDKGHWVQQPLGDWRLVEYFAGSR